jgi:formate-dependent nitrite reductase membrane component NrfD
VSDPAATTDPSTTYYDRPVLKEPVWIWSVPAYFYVGGAASGAATLAAVAQVAGMRGLVARGRWIAAVGGAVSTVLLIIDLGRPARFLNMLRVFRPTSAMSVGSWTLAAAATATSASALAPRLLPSAAGRLVGDAAGLAAGAVAPVLGTYTGVLLADTAVPVWNAARRQLPPLFAASAVASATALLDLTDLDEREAAVTRRLGIAARAAELAAGEAVERAADERIGRPLREGASGALWRTGKVCTGGALVTSLLPVPAAWRPARRIIGAVLATLGSLAMRFAVFHAGKASVRDPRATFEPQRAGRR